MNENYELIDFGQASELTQSGQEGDNDTGQTLQPQGTPAI